MRLVTFGLFLTLILILGLGCGNDAMTPVDGDDAAWLVKAPDQGNNFPGGLDPEIITPSNYYKDEATDLATWWSGELYAPAQLTHTIETELRKIRLEFSHTVPNTQIAFMPVNATGRLLFGFTDAGWEMWKNDSYHAWDSLNAALNVDSIAVTTHYPEDRKYVTIFFPGRPNVDRLKEFYEVLPEARYADGDIWCCDWPIVLMWREEEENVAHYFFRNAWGDCPSGCIYQDYAYIKVVDGEPTYIGYYLKDWEHPWLPRPEWMDIADLASAKYWPY